MSLLDPDNFSKAFPNAQLHADHRLMTWFPSGVLTDEEADRVVDFLEEAEKVEGKRFHRYTDMTGYSQIELGLDHIVRLARRRRRYAGPPIRSAFYVSRSLSQNIANLYEELMSGSNIQVCTFRDRALAAEWLGVPQSLLKQPSAKTRSDQH
jgi:hypothetical protein